MIKLALREPSDTPAVIAGGVQRQYLCGCGGTWRDGFRHRRKDMKGDSVVERDNRTQSGTQQTICLAAASGGDCHQIQRTKSRTIEMRQVKNSVGRTISSAYRAIWNVTGQLTFSNIRSRAGLKATVDQSTASFQSRRSTQPMRQVSANDLAEHDLSNMPDLRGVSAAGAVDCWSVSTDVIVANVFCNRRNPR